MPIKIQTIYSCSNCGAQSQKWQGRCIECGQWGTLQEKTFNKKNQAQEAKIEAGKIINFSEIKSGELARVKTGIEEFDRVLGGGIVPGSAVLIGGEPGIGKSTLLLQIAAVINNTLYVSGEESAQQIKMRLDRLEIKNSEMKFSSETEVEKICAAIKKVKPNLAIIDSIQTISSMELETEAGSINQIRAATVKLLHTAKKFNIPIFIIGHITKDGQVAGPKTLEHLVDTVAYLEGEEKNNFRILRAKKNRFGATSELGVFAMSPKGLQEVKNPAGAFLSDSGQGAPGTAISSILEGTRTFLIETQALASKTIFGYPQRRAFGFDTNRLQILATVLIRRANINLINQDINLNIVGGIKITEPALDLAVCLSIVSAFKNIALPNDTIIIGEVGLGGEIRKVNRLEQRIKEAEKLGFKNALIPFNSLQKKYSSINLMPVKNISEAIEKIF